MWYTGNTTNMTENRFYNNLINNTNNFYYYGDNLSTNYWNTTQRIGERIFGDGLKIGGNFWATPTGTGYSENCTDSDGNGFCDVNYTLADYNIDYIPLSGNYTFDVVPPYFTTNTNQTLYNNQSLEYQVNATDDREISGFAVDDIANFTINSTGYLINISALSVGIYNLNITINDSSNNKNSTLLMIIVSNYDLANPAITLLSPDDAYSTTTTELTLSYNVTDQSNIANCSLIISNVIDQTLTTITKGITSSFTKTFSVGSYTWSVNCTDSNNNIGNSSTRSLTITAPVVISGGGGGGGSCTPSCAGKTCGSNGCGGSCGTCLSGYECSLGSCVNATCTASWVCTQWNSCINSTKTRICTSNNGCNNPDNKPLETDSCVCTESWDCTEFGSCSNDMLTRFCDDINECGTILNKPIETTRCSYDCEESWSCDWTECDNEDLQYPMNCVDKNNCGTKDNYPSMKSCGSCSSDFRCGEWGECKADYSVNDILQDASKVNGIKERECIDANDCSSPLIQKERCSLKVPVDAKISSECNGTLIGLYNKINEDLISKVKIQDVQNISKINVRFSLINFTQYCDYCYNGIKDYDEEKIDCGGAHCPLCLDRQIQTSKISIRWWLIILILLLVIILYIELKKNRIF
jgi:hypothetical protein